MKTFIAIVTCIGLVLGSCCPERKRQARQPESGAVGRESSGQVPGGGVFYDRMAGNPDNELPDSEFGPV